MVHIRESSRTWFDKSKGHNDKIRLMDETNPMVKHQTIHHPEEEEPLEFIFTLDRSWKTSLQQQLREAIQEHDPDLLMNSKAEWGLNNIPCVKIGLDDEDFNRNSHPNQDQSSTTNLSLNGSNGSKRKRARVEFEGPISSFFLPQQSQNSIPNQ